MDATSNIEYIGARYRLERIIGTGGMGTVYHAIDRLTGRAVALKRVKTKLDDLGFASKSTDNNELALVKEFRTLSTLRHPYIINVLDYGFDRDKNPFFTMELLDGGQAIREYAAFASVTEILERVMEMLQVLMYLHRRAILHRDIKPSNLMVIDEHIKILDFGLAKSVEARSSEYTRENMAGTMAYMAPELFKGDKVSRASDLYSVGVIAFEFLTGDHPFHGKNLAHLAYEIMNAEPDWMLLDKVSDEVIDFIDRLMVKDPAQRYQDAAEALDDLRTALNYPRGQDTLEIRESFLQAARFVGRDTEYKMLRAALDDVIAGHGGAWLVAGESGVGKTRLLDELRIRALVKGVLVLRGQSTAERREAYQLWRDIARNLCIEVELSDFEAQVLKFLVPDINRLIGREVKNALVVQPQVAYERLVQVLEAVIRKYGRPIVLILEDLHWSRESIGVLKRLSHLVAEVPLLLIGSYRNDARPNLPDDLPALQLMTLERLNSAAIREMSRSILGEIGQQSSLVELLERETEGNTLFIVEVMRTLADEAGQLENIGRVTLPNRVFADGIRTVIQRRLKQVPDHAYLPLQIAAVAGRQIDPTILQTVLPDYDWERWLVQCADAAILLADEYHWYFAHDKLRESILEDIPATQRRIYSRQLAQAMEKVYGDNPLFATVLAMHWHNAGSEAKELHYAYLAAEQLHVSSNLQEMRHYLERALALAENVPISDIKRWQIEVRLAEAHSQLSDLQTAAEMLKRLLEIIPSDGDVDAICVKSEAYYHYVVAIMGQGHYEAGLKAAKAALKLVDACPEPAQKAKILWAMGLAELYNDNHPVAEKFYQQSLALAQQINDVMFTMSSYIGLGSTAAMQERFDEAITHNLKAVDLAQECGNALYESYALHNIGVFYFTAQLYSEAIPYFEGANRLARQLNSLPALALGLINLAAAHIMLDQPDIGFPILQQGVDLAQETVSIPAVLLGIGIYGVWLHKQGQEEAALQHLAFVLSHPKTQMDDIAFFKQILAQLHYSEDKLAAVYQQAAGLELGQIVAAILKLRVSDG